MSRTKKKPKTGAKAIDPSCKNHGTCPWCKGNRTYQETKERQRTAMGGKYAPEVNN